MFAYLRTFEKETVIVVCNFKKESVKWKLPDGLELKDGGELVRNYEEGEVVVNEGKVELRPFEAWVAFVK